MRYATRHLASLRGSSFTPTAFAPGTMVPGAGQYDADDSTTYQVAAIKYADARVAPLATKGFSPLAAASALPHIARSPFTGKTPVDDGMVVERDRPIADATGIERAGQEVADVREDALTPDLVIDPNNDSAFNYDPNRDCIGCQDDVRVGQRSPSPTVSTWSKLWPWAAGGGVVLAVALLALTALRRG